MSDNNIPVPPPETAPGQPRTSGEHVAAGQGPAFATQRPADPAAPPPPSRKGFWGWFHKSPPAPATPHPAPDSFREIVETVVFVVVLVLLLKSFVAEAFVIPTGSMAETLWGYQKVVTCPECDLLFPVNCASQVEEEPHKRMNSCVCPNCFKRISLLTPQEFDGIDPEKTADAGDVLDPGYSSGDRVLVGKFLYDLFGWNPHRLDVVVFKFPGNSEGGFPHTGPYNKDYVPMNYIKRLIGFGGETIAICNGKIYILPADKSPRYDDLKQAKTAQEREEMRTLLWQWQFMHVDDPAAQELFKEGKFTILRKAPEHLLAMMRLVYDNDHQARDLKDDPSYRRWREDKESTWLEAKDHGFHHAPATGEALAWLRYHQHTRRDQHDTFIHPYMGYNPPGPDMDVWVGDLILECEATIDKPEGEFVMELSKGPDRFQARWNLADGLCSLHRITTEKDGRQVHEKDLDKKTTVLTHGTHRLRFANVDQRLTVWVDGKLVFGDGVPYDVPAPPQKTDNDLQPANIGAQGASVDVKHLKLFHDTYYSNTGRKNDGTDTAVMTMYVQPDHFLCLGDNSFHSSDSRAWGTVPRRLMLGKAVVVYYPFYFPIWPLNSQVNRVGLIH